MPDVLPPPPGSWTLDLAADLVSEFARAAIRARRRAVQAAAKARRPRRGSVLRPGPDTPLWNELVRAVNEQFRRRGDRANLGRILGLPRQRITEMFRRRRHLLDAERTLLLLIWLQARREQRDNFERRNEAVPVLTDRATPNHLTSESRYYVTCRSGREPPGRRALQDDGRDARRGLVTHYVTCKDGEAGVDGARPGWRAGACLRMNMGHAWSTQRSGWRALLIAIGGALGTGAGSAAIPPVAPAPQFKIETAPPGAGPQVMLGIDVLAAGGFAELRGKKIGLLTHPAGVDRHGRSTIDVLRHAPGVMLVALFGPEHGIRGDAAANVAVANSVDPQTGLPVFSLYGGTRKPTKTMLRGLDALVIDLQDIGSRSYTFTSAMRRALEGCFENGVEVVVLDRPNPLGGIKVAGPLLDAAWSHRNYVGAFRVPYVHGLTIGELARMTKGAPSPDFPEAIRQRGRLTVVPMRGWDRTMRWPETGLKWVPTSGLLPDWEAVQGYPMTGLATFWDPPRMDIGFRHGLGPNFPYRGLSFKGVGLDTLERELRTLDVAGVQFRRVQTFDREGRPMAGMYVDIVDYDAWEPTELNVHLMKLACRLAGTNPFTPAPGRSFDLFLRHLGSADFLSALAREGADLDVRAWVERWREQAAIYREQSRKYWLY